MAEVVAKVMAAEATVAAVGVLMAEVEELAVEATGLAVRAAEIVAEEVAGAATVAQAVVKAAEAVALAVEALVFGTAAEQAEAGRRTTRRR